VSTIAWISPDTPPEASMLGGKGAGLASLAAAGLRVPPAFVITTEAYRRAVAEPLGEELERALAAIPDRAPDAELERAAAAARERILAVPERHGLRDEIETAYARLGAEAGEDPAPVAVRSSATGEDSGGQSFAGGHDSHLWVVGADEVQARVRECWASLYTARAVSYRAHGGLVDEAVMGVVVQQMADARSAGVFMTLDPSNGDRSSVVVESVWGLGEPLVSGQATPDRFVVNKITGDVVRRQIALKPAELVRDPASGRGTVQREVPADRRERSSLESAELDELVRMARVLEELAGAPQDCEFAVTAGEPPENVRLLQCRPETVWSQRKPRTIAGRRSALQSVLSTLTGEDRA